MYNVLAAIAVGLYIKYSIGFNHTFCRGSHWRTGRFEAVNGGQDFSVIVDYAHTPDSLENVLKTIQQFAKKRIFADCGLWW